MAAVLLREGNFRDAETAYRDVLKSDPKNAELHDSLGVALLMQGKVRESIDSFDRAIKLSPDFGRYRVHRGSARTQLGRYGEAEEDFRVADGSSVPEDRFDAQVHRGHMRQRQGDFAGAETEFTGALRQDPKSFEALIGRGASREALKNYSGAAEDYLAAVKTKHALEGNFWAKILLVRYANHPAGHAYCVWETEGTIYSYDRNAGSFPIPVYTRDARAIAVVLASGLSDVLKERLSVSNAEFVEAGSADLRKF